MEREIDNILNEKCRKLFGLPPYAMDKDCNPSYLNRDFYDELCEQYGKEKVDLTHTSLLEREELDDYGL